MGDRSPRSRARILANLESVYRDAYERAKAAGDERRMADLDSAFQREQLLLEVLLDIRDTVATPRKGQGRRAGTDPVAALDTI
ncbi:MAG: hypothetical protein ACREMR_06940, partial [Gemmatimonadales bacterium]